MGGRKDDRLLLSPVKVDTIKVRIILAPPPFSFRVSSNALVARHPCSVQRPPLLQGNGSACW